MGRCGGSWWRLMGDLTEAQFQSQIVAYAQLRGWLVSHVQSVTMQGKGGRVIRQTPAARGFPDLTLARRGFVWFMEVKTESGSVSPVQRGWLNEMAGVAEWKWRSRGDLPDKTVVLGRGLSMTPGFGVVVVRPRHWEWIQEVLK